MAAIKTAKGKKLKTPKALSRDRLKEELGSAIEINMRDTTKARLKAICKMFGHDKIDSVKRGTGRIYSQVLDELINIFYFDELLEPEQPEAKRLYDLYDELYILKFREGKTSGEIVTYMTKHKRGRPKNPNDTKWQDEDIERLLIARKVVNKIMSIEDVAN